LSKPAKLSSIEYSFIKTHPQAGYEILKGIKFPWPIAQMVLQHHERFDGLGYPQVSKATLSCWKRAYWPWPMWSKPCIRTARTARLGMEAHLPRSNAAAASNMIQRPPQRVSK